MLTHSSIPAWKNPMDRGAWQATVHGGRKESDMTERLHFHFLSSSIYIFFYNYICISIFIYHLILLYNVYICIYLYVIYIHLQLHFCVCVSTPFIQFYIYIYPLIHFCKVFLCKSHYRHISGAQDPELEIMTTLTFSREAQRWSTCCLLFCHLFPGFSSFLHQDDITEPFGLCEMMGPFLHLAPRTMFSVANKSQD